MTTTFKLDMGFLDNIISFMCASEREVEIRGEAAAVYLDVDDVARVKLTYRFYLDLLGKNGHGIPPALLNCFLSKGIPHGGSSLEFRKANVHLISIKDGVKYIFGTKSAPMQRDTALERFSEAVYVYGEFWKGDAEKFKQYGVTLLGD